MSLPSNYVGNCKDVEQDLSDGWSKVGDEDQSTTLTDDITQKLDCSEEVDKDDQKTSSSTNKWIQKISTKVLTALTTKEKIDVFKHFNFNKLTAFQKICRYFNNFINENKNELARDYLNIRIVDKLVMPKGPYFKYKELNIKVKSYDFVLNDDLKKKVRISF
ncbi:unnamed protein product [Meloidogyne enterolobii]|uniref:Uncharacterized protein n=1 Tax=Meloidogyne enterolobii TaxID=390850 RepID=A0ACB1AIS1_MELEN